MIIEADLELIEDAFSAKNIEADSKALREPDGGGNLKFPNTESEIMEIGRNVTPVSYHDHLESAILDIDSHPLCGSFMEDTKHGSGVNINPYLFVKNGDRNYRH